LTTSPKPCIITIIDTGKRKEQMKETHDKRNGNKGVKKETPLKKQITWGTIKNTR